MPNFQKLKLEYDLVATICISIDILIIFINTLFPGRLCTLKYEAKLLSFLLDTVSHIHIHLKSDINNNKSD